MDLSFISELYIPIVLVACLIVGYCIKNIKWLDRISNEYIPSILAILGAVLGCVANCSITFENIVYGALSGLSSTGMHQMFKQWINKHGGTDNE
jgi:hypothetical protein